jgi:hypothetical protein
VNLFFPIYYFMFAIVLFVSFCHTKVIAQQFLALKTTIGRGAFNCFVGGMLATQISEAKVINILALVLCILFWACGIFFITVALATPKMTDLEIKNAVLKAGLPASTLTESLTGEPEGDEVQHPYRANEY